MTEGSDGWLDIIIVIANGGGEEASKKSAVGRREVERDRKVPRNISEDR